MPENNNGRIVLIAMDNSESSKYAFEWYVKNLRQEDDKVVVVNSVNPVDVVMVPSYYTVPFAFDKEMLESMMGHEANLIREKLEELASIMISHNIKGTIKSIHASTPGHGIIHMSSKVKADLIVMGSRRHNKLRRTVFGSVSDYVMHHSNVPVIVCRNKDNHRGVIKRH